MKSKKLSDFIEYNYLDNFINIDLFEFFTNFTNSNYFHDYLLNKINLINLIKGAYIRARSRSAAINVTSCSLMRDTWLIEKLWD